MFLEKLELRTKLAHQIVNVDGACLNFEGELICALVEVVEDLGDDGSQFSRLDEVFRVVL